MSKQKYILIDNQKRGKLCEGRNYGFSSGFAKREANKLTMVMPITACGDFLAEPIHSEHTGKSWSIYGLNYSKQNIFDDKNGFAYIVAGILPINNAGKYANQDRDTKALADNYKHLEKFINWFEKQFKLDKFTQIIKLKEENRYLFIVPLFWCAGTYLISLHKFLSRMGIHYTGGDCMAYLDNFNQESGDANMYKQIKPKLQKMLAGEIPKQIMTNKDYCPHNLGICTFVFPKDKTTNTAAELYGGTNAPIAKAKGTITAKGVCTLSPMKF